MYNLASLLPEELESLLKDMGQPAFRGRQLFIWLQRGVKRYEQMTNIPKSLREQLQTEYPLRPPKLLRKQTSESDGTHKFLWELADGHTIESVVMQYRHGNTVCISTQIGCKMGCAFCASGIDGFSRQLEPAEMLGQVRFSGIESNLQISNVVLMGIGEPLDNFERVIRFLELLRHPDGMHIGGRHITLSTCGLPQGIDKLACYQLQLTLSVSLHAPDNETRDLIMPINRRYPLDEVFAACRQYAAKTGRRVSFEYTLIDGVNDSPRHAKLLAARLQETGGHVNLIPLNAAAGCNLRPSPPACVRQFADILQNRGIAVTVRRRLGEDITAACGQLRRNKM